MKRGLWFLVVIALGVAVAGEGASVVEPTQRHEKRGANYGQCPCPCELACGEGLSCKCTGGHGRCICGGVSLSSAQMGGIATGEPPLMQYEHASWFEAASFSSIDVSIEGSAGGVHEPTKYRFTLIPSKKSRGLYVPDRSFNQREYELWASTVDTKQPGKLVIAASGDSLADYAIRDGDLSHLHESLTKRFSFVPPGRAPIGVLSSDSTLAWEIQNAVRTAITCLEDGAITGDPTKARDELYGRIGSVELLLQARDVAGAVTALAEVESDVKALGLDPGHPNSERLLRIVAAARSLLATGRGTAK